MTKDLTKVILLIIELINKNKLLNSDNQILEKAINEKKENINNLIEIGIECAQLKKFDEAIYIFLGLSNFIKTDSRIYYNLGIIYSINKKHKDALKAYEKALIISPNDAEILVNKGCTLNDLSSYEHALEILKLAIKINPNIAEAWSNLGIALNNLGNYRESIEAYNTAIDLNGSYIEAWSNKSIPLRQLGMYQESLNACERAINLKPDYAEGWSNKGNTLFELKRYDEALMHYDRALFLKPDYAEGWSNKGNTLFELKRYDEALMHYDRALFLKPDYAEGWSNKANTLFELKRYEEALTHHDRALSLKPDYAEGWSNKANTLFQLKRYEEALTHYDQAYALNKKINWLLGNYLLLKAQVGNWLNFDQLIRELIQSINVGEKVALPFASLALTDDEEIHYKASHIFSSVKFPSNQKLGPILKRTKKEKIKLGYFSGDFREHAVAYLTADLFSNHDRKKFEIIGFAWDVSNEDLMTQRISISFDRFINVSDMSSLQIAKLSRELEIDIAIDLMGYTQNSRTDIFSFRAAPIQCGYIGYLGSMGSDYFDYIIGDKTVIPYKNKKYFGEKVVYLPCFQSNDSKREDLNLTHNRESYGIAKDAFVFCCFNGNYKINPQQFQIWVDILKSVENSILWLVQGSNLFQKNILTEVSKAGLNENRIYFAPQVKRKEYLERYQIADLFLDTVPYNAGTTASDALWSELPVLTKIGNSYPGRMAASLLKTLDLEELIVHTWSEYRNIAIDLATHPKRLAGIKRKLIEKRQNSRLFNSQIFCENLESAYIKMHLMYTSNDKFEDIEVLSSY